MFRYPDEVFSDANDTVLYIRGGKRSSGEVVAFKEHMLAAQQPQGPALAVDNTTELAQPNAEVVKRDRELEVLFQNMLEMA